MKKNRKITILLFLMSLMFVHSAEANYPIYQISHIVNFPSTAVFQTMGLAFLIIVLIEVFVLKKLGELTYKKAFFYALLANLFSTVLGVISYPGSSAMMILPMIIIGSGFLAGMTKAINTHGRYVQTKGLGLIAYFIFIGLGFITLRLIPLTIPGGKGLLHAERLYFANNLEVFIAIIAAFGLLAIGYLISVVSEGYIFTKLFPKGHRFLGTILRMNLFSYVVLIIILSPNIKTVIQEKSWWFHSAQRYNISGDLKQKESLVLYESVSGDWGTIVSSSTDTLTSLDYEIKRVWPDDKFQKKFKEIETKYTSLNEAKRKLNFPTSIQLNIDRENEQTKEMTLEIILRGYETDDGYLPDLKKHVDSGCLSGPLKTALAQSFLKNNYDLKCTTSRWTKN